VGPLSALGYGPIVTRLLADAGLNPLGPGSSQPAARAALAQMSPTSVVAPRALLDREMALACCAAIWLRFDFLDQSHQISQSIDTPEGSFWHGVMHRRETDFANARYWFRRAGKHETFGTMAEMARSLVGEELAQAAARDPRPSSTTTARPGPLGKDIRFLSDQEVWDPLRFVDLCELALDASPPLHTFCRRLQQLEWQVMFDHCYRCAAAEA
jgi:hypothetical protein